ncbi:MAG: universal stress protein [Deltaproteobacteria bacterium]|jgi:nucleotide-binding universal stress UspA family protein|nr:universal stress protein [Deltaproteobacteria bacterium]MBW2480346.1 universal stress protein [Deltaproteobacteria bacterium]
MKFLVCYDGSTAATEALKLAQMHAGVWNAELEVVYVLSREEPLKHTFIKNEEDNLANKLKTLLGDGEISYNGRVYVTSLTVGEQLVEFAESKKVDQVFVGITKTSKVGKLLFGSTAQYVILHSPCPVVTVHP